MTEKQQIDWQQLKQHLCFLYSYKMDIPLLEDKEKNADMVITRIVVKFLQKYSRLLRLKYTFIVDYRNDAYSFLAYRIIRSAASAINSVTVPPGPGAPSHLRIEGDPSGAPGSHRPQGQNRWTWLPGKEHQQMHPSPWEARTQRG